MVFGKILLLGKNKFITIAKIVLVCVCIYLVGVSGFGALLQAKLEWQLAFAALSVQPFVFSCVVLLAIRHVLLIRTPRVSLKVALRAIILSQGLNLVLPVRLSELLKVTYLRDHASVPLSSGLSAVVLERMVDIMIVAALGGLALLAYFDRGDFVSIPALGFVVAILVFVLVRFPKLIVSFFLCMPSARLAGFLERAYWHFSFTVGTRAFWQALLLGGLAWGLSYVNILVFLTLAGSLPIGFSSALLVFVITTLGGAIPALPGGLGTYEAAAVIALRSLGYSFDEALMLSISMHAAQLVLPFVLAVLIMLTERLGISSLVADLRRSAAAEGEIGNSQIKKSGIND